jgi:general secretion pathway protein G
MSAHLYLHKFKELTMKKKRALTLLEIMIVIFLIGLIGSVIGYNMKGSLEEGKAFKTKQAQAQIHDILELAMAKGIPADEIADNAEALLKDSGLVKDPKKMLQDGWNQPFSIKVRGSDGKITIASKKLDEYNEKKSGVTKKSLEETDEEE